MYIRHIPQLTRLETSLKCLYITCNTVDQKHSKCANRCMRIRGTRWQPLGLYCHIYHYTDLVQSTFEFAKKSSEDLMFVRPTIFKFRERSKSHLLRHHDFNQYLIWLNMVRCRPTILLCSKTPTQIGVYQYIRKLVRIDIIIDFMIWTSVIMLTIVDNGFVCIIHADGARI